MKFSLIIGTLNRKESLSMCLDSLFKQTYKDYEIIIIDQSDNDETCDYIKLLSRQEIIYKKVNYRGLSRARNEALKIATGDYFCLIDDDAYYDCNYLKNAMEGILNYQVIISGYILDTVTDKPFAKYIKEKNNKKLSTRMIIKTCPSAALVVPMSVVNNIGFFDEELGVGGKYGAGEESDYLLRAINEGYSVYYNENCKLMHPVPISKDASVNSINKMASYYSGIGALYKKHKNSNWHIAVCYCEQWLKFIIKKIMFYRYDVKEINAYIEGFKKGLDEYHIEKCDT